MSFFDPADEADKHAHTQWKRGLRDREYEPEEPTFDPDPDLCACKGSGEVGFYPDDKVCPYHADDVSALDIAWENRMRAIEAAHTHDRPELAKYDRDALRDRLEGWD